MVSYGSCNTDFISFCFLGRGGPQWLVYEAKHSIKSAVTLYDPAWISAGGGQQFFKGEDQKAGDGSWTPGFLANLPHKIPLNETTILVSF